MMNPFAGIRAEKIWLSVISGLALSLAFPLPEISYVAWVGLVFLLYAIRDVSVRKSFILGMITGMVHYASLLYWLIITMHIYGYLVWWLSVIIFIPLVFYLSLYVAAFSGLVRFADTGPLVSVLLIPAVWVCLEYVRAVAFTGFPWDLLGYSQYSHLYVIQMADIFGIYGVSFVVVLVNAVLFFGLLYIKKESWQGRLTDARQTVLAFAMLVLAIAMVLGYGNFRLKSVDKMMAGSEKINAAVIQGNIPQDVKWDLKFRNDTIRKYILLSGQAAQSGPDLIVWPETALPFYFKYNIGMTKMVLQAISGMKTWFLVGSPTVEFVQNKDYYYNSAYLVSPEGDIVSRNDKVHLVPFGEYVPFKKWLPFINHIVAQVGEFKAGKKDDTLKWPTADIGVLICYETIFPELARELAASGAGLLVNITNDAWFGKTGAPYQHFSMAVFRAVENRRSLIRAANTGISGFIDPAGRILKQTKLFVEAIQTCPVPMIKDQTTFFTRHGNVAVLACFIFLIFIIINRLKNRGFQQPGDQ